MTISSSGIHGAIRAYGGQKIISTDKKDRVEIKPEVDEDEVVLSSKARDLKKAAAIVKNSSEVRHEKIARLSADIKAGRYKVDADGIARLILNEVSEFSREV